MSHPDVVVASRAEFHPVEEDLLPDDPFTSLNYHFGMLLGVDDFETEQAYQRGKMRLHQGWLHGPGVVWGLGVAVDVAHGEVRVERGLALDGAGRELHLDADACLDPAAWLTEHRDAVTPAEAPPEGTELAFDAHVVMSFASCLTRQVPALAEPCEGARVETAYSRVWETIDLRLVPGPAPAPVERYRRVRILLGLLEPREDDADDAAAASARADVLALAPELRASAALAAFRAMANADAEAMRPADAGDGPRVLTPDSPSAGVVLATIRGLALKQGDDGLVLAGGTVDVGERRSHVQTATAQELSVAALTAAEAPAPPPAGPHITGATLADSTAAEDTEELRRLVLTLSAPLDERSVRSEAFRVTTLTAEGWVDVPFDDPPDYDATAAPPTVTLDLSSQPAPPWQVIARGTGARPLVDDAAQRLGGGQDFVHIQPPPTRN